MANAGTFKKGEKRPNQGRPKGMTNKVPLEVKKMILEALEGAGGVQYLIDCAQDPKTASAFLTLVGKVMPMQVQGDPDNPMKLSVTVSFD